VTRLNVNHIDFISLAPFLKYLGDKLRTIIASYILWLAIKLRNPDHGRPVNPLKIS